jgi:hypothetical protein
MWWSLKEILNIIYCIGLLIVELHGSCIVPAQVFMVLYVDWDNPSDLSWGRCSSNQLKLLLFLQSFLKLDDRMYLVMYLCDIVCFAMSQAVSCTYSSSKTLSFLNQWCHSHRLTSDIHCSLYTIQSIFNVSSINFLSLAKWHISFLLEAMHFLH